MRQIMKVMKALMPGWSVMRQWHNRLLECTHLDTFANIQVPEPLIILLFNLLSQWRTQLLHLLLILIP